MQKNKEKPISVDKMTFWKPRCPNGKLIIFFLKTGFNKNENLQEFSEHHFGATWSIFVPFLTPSDFEMGPQIDNFQNKSKNNERK